MRNLPILIIVFVFLSSCTQPKEKLNYINSSKAAFNLIKLCVDSTLKVRDEINTNNYVVDLSGIRNLNRAGQDSFSRFKFSALPTTNQDSVIVYDSTWETFHVAKSMIIKFDSIHSRDDGEVSVVIRKIRSSDKIVTLKLVLRRKHDGYTFVRDEQFN